jgi:PAS domain S-box-containing protein
MNTLGQSEETFRILAESIPVMVWSARSDGFIEYFNPHALAFMGLSREELCGWGWRKLIHLDDAPQAQAAWDQAVRSGKPYNTDHRIRRNDGLYYWVAARGQPVSTQDGQVQRWVGTFVEIQGQRHATEDPILHVDTVAFQDNLQEDNTAQEMAIQTPDMGLFDYDLMTGEVNFSPGYKRQLGYQNEEFADNLREMDIRLHPEDRERVTQTLHTYLADPRPFYQSQYRVRHKDGDYRWMLVRVELIRNVSGRPCHVLGCQLDLTERNRAEEDRARLAAIVQSSEDAIIGKTLSGIVTNWNEGARRLLGYTAEEMVGQPLSRIIPMDRLDEELTILARLGRGERVEHIETVRRHKDGSLVDVSVSISPIRDASGRIVGASKIARDVGARKRAQAAVEQANEQLRENAMVLELAPVLVRDMDNRIVLWTRGAERLYGFSKEEALGRISHELFQTTFPESVEHFDEILRRNGRWEGELVHRKRDGERLVVASQQIIYHDLVGQPVRILEANADITERERAEAELSQSREQLRALTDSLLRAREEEATRIARELHDQFGRYLTTIKMDVRSIERDLVGELTSDVVGILREKAQTIAHTVDETVQTVRAIATQLRPGLLDDLGLAAAIEWQAKDFQKRSGILCDLTLPGDDPDLSRDQATAIFRIFQEILTNVARHAQATKVWVHLGEEQGAIVLEVEDNGVGISPTQLAERRSLGLLGMRERAGVFGGVVEIVGSQGRGTTVIVQMPLLKTNDENLDR